MSVSLHEGDIAPDFTAPVSGGEALTLSKCRGHPVVLYFYPRDDTPGCTKEACAFRDVHEAFLARRARVFGISPDAVKSHDRFVAKYQLPFQLVADPDHVIADAYGVWGEKSFLGRRYFGIRRVTFLIDAEGRIAKIWPVVKPGSHAAEVLAAIPAPF